MYHAQLGNEVTEPQSVAISDSSADVNSLESASAHSHDHNSIKDHFEELEALTPRPSAFSKRRTEVSNHPNDNPLSKQATSIQTTEIFHPGFEVDWDGDDDQLNPRNWPLWYRSLIIGAVSYSTWSV